MRNIIGIALLLSFLPVLAEDELDLSPVKKIVFVGDGSTIELTTDASRPYRLVQDKSWSFWSSCRLTQRLEQGVLTLGVDSGNARPWRRCNVTYRANLPALRQVEILQGANNVRAEGQFERLAVHSAASDVTFRGNANELSLKGSALKADVRLTGATPRGKVQVEARVGSVYLGIDQKAAVSYQLEGTLASFDRGWVNHPDAPLRVDVTGDLLQATLAYQK
jgi:hypothetical protein